VSRVTPDGQVTQILSGIIDSQSEHQVNDVKIGPDGRMYLAVGRAANSAVVGPDIAPFVMLSPGLHARPCQDIVLRGHNFLTADFRTEAQGDSVLTGAFVPFGTATQPGQRIPGVTKCGGSILVFDPANAEATLQVHASGFRQPIGLAWNRQTGEMFVGENGPDVRGPRPVRDEFDATLRVQAGHWYGWPDYSSAREPLTLDKFDVPDSLQAPIFRGTQERLGRFLDFVIDHEASGLTPPNRSLVLGLHPYQSSPSFLDVAPASWGDLAGQLFVAEWGDLRPNTNPLAPREQVAGFRIVRVDPNRSQAPVEAFIQNRLPGPASEQGARGQGLERPFDVKFGPDGAMYIVDFGEVEVLANQMPPYNQRPGTGAIWRIVRTGM
jgi:glucose/arabinose dehydrogenase